MNELIQQQAARDGSLILGFAFGFLTEGNDVQKFFFFYGIALSIFQEYNITLKIKTDE